MARSRVYRFVGRGVGVLHCGTFFGVHRLFFVAPNRLPLLVQTASPYQNRTVGLCLIAAAAVSGACSQGSRPDRTQPAAAHDMRLVGVHPLEGRAAYQPVLNNYGDRRILFVGHHAGEANGIPNGVSILDVTSPATPDLLTHLPPTGPGVSGAQHVQVCEGDELPRRDASGTRGRVYLLRTNGQVSHEIWDVTNPADPLFVVTVATTEESGSRYKNTHKNWWDCESGVGYLVSSAPGWRVPRVLRAFDLRDPSEPLHIRDFALDGMQTGQDIDLEDVPGVHQATVRENRIYVAYGPYANGLVQILDRDKFLDGAPDAERPFAPSAENLRYPEISRWKMNKYEGAHTAKPLGPRWNAEGGDAECNFMVVGSEEIEFGCDGPRHALHFVDVTDESRPTEAAAFQVIDESGYFCRQGGRFGPHGFNESPNRWLDGKVLLVAYFNAGVRAIDIRDPTQPVEIAHFIPEVTERTQPSCAADLFGEECAAVIQTNNVETDDRGYIYLLDRNGTGLHILEFTGAARRLIGLPESPN